MKVTKKSNEGKWTALYRKWKAEGEPSRIGGYRVHQSSEDGEVFFIKDAGVENYSSVGRLG